MKMRHNDSTFLISQEKDAQEGKCSQSRQEKEESEEVRWTHTNKDRVTHEGRTYEQRGPGSTEINEKGAVL
jgi:hypothetical protein